MSNEKRNISQQRVLVVDDEISIQRFLRSVLIAEGFLLNITDNGAAALSAAAL
jgi:DNA-binding response OmpR family regulator